MLETSSNVSCLHYQLLTSPLKRLTCKSFHLLYPTILPVFFPHVMQSTFSKYNIKSVPKNWKSTKTQWNSTAPQHFFKYWKPQPYLWLEVEGASCYAIFTSSKLDIFLTPFSPFREHWSKALEKQIKSVSIPSRTYLSSVNSKFIVLSNTSNPKYLKNTSLNKFSKIASSIPWSKSQIANTQFHPKNGQHQHWPRKPI